MRAQGRGGACGPAGAPARLVAGAGFPSELRERRRALKIQEAFARLRVSEFSVWNALHSFDLVSSCGSCSGRFLCLVCSKSGLFVRQHTRFGRRFQSETRRDSVQVSCG